MKSQYQSMKCKTGSLEHPMLFWSFLSFKLEWKPDPSLKLDGGKYLHSITTKGTLKVSSVGSLNEVDLSIHDQIFPTLLKLVLKCA